MYGGLFLLFVSLGFFFSVKNLTCSFSLLDSVAKMLSFFRRTLGRRSMRKHAEKERLREAQRAATHIPAAGDAKSIITCRVALLDGTDVSVDLPVRVIQVCF